MPSWPRHSDVCVDSFVTCIEQFDIFRSSTCVSDSRLSFTAGVWWSGWDSSFCLFSCVWEFTHLTSPQSCCGAWRAESVKELKILLKLSLFEILSLFEPSSFILLSLGGKCIVSCFVSSDILLSVKSISVKGVEICLLRSFSSGRVHLGSVRSIKGWGKEKINSAMSENTVVTHILPQIRHRASTSLYSKRESSGKLWQ